jgi:hypothetical protein
MVRIRFYLSRSQLNFGIRMQHILALLLTGTLVLAPPLGAQDSRWWFASAGIARTTGGNYNVRGALLGTLGYEPRSAADVAPFAEALVSSGGMLNGRCTSFGEYCFRHFPAWSALAAGGRFRWIVPHVALRARAGAGVLGYQERDSVRGVGPARGGYTLVGYLGADASLGPGHRVQPLIAVRSLCFRGPRAATLCTSGIGLGAHF